jgi:hypothetical protein
MAQVRMQRLPNMEPLMPEIMEAPLYIPLPIYWLLVTMASAPVMA